MSYPEDWTALKSIVFRSLADQDSDRWIFEVLDPKLRRRMKGLKAEMQWTDIV